MASKYKKADGRAVDVESVWLQNSRKTPFLNVSDILAKSNVVFLLLRYALIQKGHCAKLMVKKGDVLFFGIWCIC